MPDASIIVAIIVKRCIFNESRLLATAQVTKAMQSTGIEYKGNINPTFAVFIDMWRNCDVAKSAAIIKTTANQRSKRGALLKKAHHTTTANAKESPPRIPIIIASGIKTGITNLKRNCMITITTPGHNLSGFCCVSPVVFWLASIIKVCLFLKIFCMAMLQKFMDFIIINHCCPIKTL